NEDPRVVQAIRALHGSGAEPSVDAALLKVAERAILARPGEKDTGLQGFMERMRSLEAIASSYDGVTRAFAMRSGKEVRVLVAANVENAADGFGITPELSEELLACGIDCMTSGNHIWDKTEIVDYLPGQPRLLRPLNYPDRAPGAGWYLGETPAGIPVAVINL